MKQSNTRQLLGMEESISDRMNTLTTREDFRGIMFTKAHSASSISAALYSRCSMLGISPIEAGNAMSFSHNWYRYWFQPGEGIAPRYDQEKTSVLKKQKEVLGSCQQCTDDHKLEDDSEDQRSENCSSLHRSFNLILTDDMVRLRNRVLHELRSSNGDITAPEFVKHLDMLSERYKNSLPSNDCNTHGLEEGSWVTLNKPHFRDCLGQNHKTGEYMYTLGRMSFDMMPRGDLKCCIKGMFNIISDPTEQIEKEGLLLPRTVKEKDLSELLAYNTFVAFTIDGTNQRALLTNHGYMLPDPKIPHHFSIWFSRVILVPDFSANHSFQDDGLLSDWKELFGGDGARRGLVGHAKVMAEKLLLGTHIVDRMEEDGSMEYIFKKPILGYCDVSSLAYPLSFLKSISPYEFSIYCIFQDAVPG